MTHHGLRYLALCALVSVAGTTAAHAQRFEAAVNAQQLTYKFKGAAGTDRQTGCFSAGRARSASASCDWGLSGFTGQLNAGDGVLPVRTSAVPPRRSVSPPRPGSSWASRVRHVARRPTP